MTGSNVLCPFCWRQVLPADGSLCMALAPRLSYHLWDEHPYETAILRIHLERPRAEWPDLELAAA